jgi:asparagine synthase (glutamine-hydrolysing)
MLEEPVATTSALGVRAVARYASEHVPVLLSGQGADELLAGYWRYVGEWLAGNATRLPPPFTALLPRLSSKSAQVRSVRLERGLRALRSQDTLSRFIDIYALFTKTQKQQLLRPEVATEIQRLAPYPAEARIEQLRLDRAARDPLCQMMYVDLRLWLPDDLLLVADKMSMAESVEVRVPFLDAGLVEFVESLPSSFKLRWGRRKAIEKHALKPVLPRTIIHRKERGFATPMERWLRTSMRAFVTDLLLATDSFATCVFSRDATEALLRRHASGEFDYTRQIFCLLSLELWARRFLDANRADARIAAAAHPEAQTAPSG